MILILSQEFDPSTDEVINWLEYYGVKYFRLNDTDICKIKSVELKNGDLNFMIEANSKKISLNKLSSYWYRRGLFNIDYSKKIKEKNELHRSLNKFIEDERNKLEEIIHKYLKKIPHIGSYLDNRINKMESLIIASNCGLTIPATVITSSKKELRNFITKHKAVITKPIYESRVIDFENKRNIGYTSLVDLEFVSKLPINFPPTLFQEALTKEFELRIFYLDKKLYSTAIFSQLDEQTKVDFRNYNQMKPNRVVPYNIPLEIEKKLIKFMEISGYRTGSIDMIVTNKEYVFLEVNPIGQFSQVSIPGNYHLHKILAERLIKL